MSDNSSTILPLSPEVAAQVTSSTSIPSLASVVLGLVANSLDAKAKNINIVVDFSRGTVSVEDDGQGIPPDEFAETGGLGKLYHTSKNRSANVSYGGKGTFLTSVAALSILTITSHHRAHAKHATLILHRSRPAARLIPAPSHHYLSHREHGTRITVQDLFGNMPVRVKQRAVGSVNGEDEKQLQALKRQIVGLLLAWHIPVSVSVKSAESNWKLRIRDSQDLVLDRKVEESLSRDLDLSLVRRTLSQAGLIEPLGWDDWIRLSARTPFIKIKGAISLRPAPSKQVQFISLGIHPVSAEVVTSLYDEVNRHFASSNFGNREETSDLEEATRISRINGGRRKGDGFTNKQLKVGGKGVDRWPMFCIRIELCENAKWEHEGNGERLREDTLSSLLKVLGTMTIRFLEENHFRPGSRRFRKRGQHTPRKPEACGSNLSRQGSYGTLQIPTENNDAYQKHAFSGWSRIKVGANVVRPALSPSSSSFQSQATAVAFGRKGFVDPCLGSPASHEPLAIADVGASGFETSQDDEQTLEWKNPESGATVLVNARTGLVVHPQLARRPATAPSRLGKSAQLSLGGSSITAVARHASFPFAIPKAGSWSSGLLAKWENPVFHATEEAIPQVSLDSPNIEAADVLQNRRHCCSNADIHKAFLQSSSSSSARLSKAALKTARIISQVDKKFILICMNDSSHTSGSQEDELLVLVDQHAADERIRIESLLADLHSCPKVLAKPIIFEVQAHEGAVLARQIAYFADWGILYDVIIPPGSKTCRLSANALPAAIAERCRIEPKVLIELLRAEAWKRDEAGISKPTRLCPQGLLDLLNSRACRSAVMFNDELAREECQMLIRRLGDCDFPFQCAHGRPSMVPLVDLGPGASLGLGERAFGAGRSGGVVEREFGNAWRGWKPGGLSEGG